MNFPVFVNDLVQYDHQFVNSIKMAQIMHQHRSFNASSATYKLSISTLSNLLANLTAITAVLLDPTTPHDVPQLSSSGRVSCIMKPTGTATSAALPTGRRLFSLSCALLACGLCGAFFAPPPLSTTLHSTSRSVTPVVVGGRRVKQLNADVSLRMQQQGGSADDQFKVAVHTLATQVEELAVFVRQLSEQTSGAQAAASSEQKNINGATVKGDAAVPTVALGKKKGAGTKELVR